MKKTNQKKRIYNLLIAILIVLISFLPYIHDFTFFNEKDGFSGYSSLRMGLFFVSMYVVAISGWIFAFINSKGKQYRFVMLAPLIMLVFQLFINILNNRKHAVNGVSVKVLVNFGIVFLIILLYFYLKRKGTKYE